MRSNKKYPNAGITPLKPMFGVPSSACKVHPVRSIAAFVLLYSSSHSPFALAVVPDHATSLMTTSSALKLGGGVNVGVGVLVAVFVGVSVGVNVNVFVGVSVGVLVGVLVGISVGVSLIVGVSVGVKVSVRVAVLGGVLVGVFVGELQGFAADDVLRGFGPPVAKSVLLLSVSVQPFAARESDSVLLGVGAAALSLQFVPEPYPTKSITLADKGQPLPVKSVVLLTKATFPAPKAIPTF